jgi:hypothetical protein
MRRPALTLTLAALVVGVPSPAKAQPNVDVARADALFNAAKALLDSGQYADACAKFAESSRLVPGLGVTLYLADCYERIGRFASAWTQFRSAEGLARERNDKRADVARERAQALEPRVNRLTIAVGPMVPRTGIQVLLDGVPVAPEEWGLPVAVDPGDRVTVVIAPGHPPRSITTHLGPDNPTAVVKIDSLDEGSPPPSASAASTIPAAPFTPPPSQASANGRAPEPPREGGSSEPPRGSERRWIGIGVGAAGVVGLGIGAGFGVAAKSKLDQSNAGPCGAGDRCTQQGLGLRQDASNAATVSTVAFVLGGVAAAAGVVLYVTAPHGSSATSTGMTIAPLPLLGGGGAMLTGAL